jgi:hypothetical protein
LYPLQKGTLHACNLTPIQPWMRDFVVELVDVRTMFIGWIRILSLGYT